MRQETPGAQFSRREILAGLAAVPFASATVRASVDAIEQNTVLNSLAEPMLEQVVFWRWYGGLYSAFHVADWRRLELCGHPRPRGRLWVCEWRENGRQYVVESPIYYRTIGTIDTEVRDREHLAQEQRRGLG